MVPDKQALIDLAHAKMPFGKYKDRYLIELTRVLHYMVPQQGLPQREIGRPTAADLRNKSQWSGRFNTEY